MGWWYLVGTLAFGFQAVVMWMLFDETARGLYLAGLLVALVAAICSGVASLWRLRPATPTKGQDCGVTRARHLAARSCRRAR